MKTIEIQLELILPKTNFMRDKTDRYDILGQIYHWHKLSVPVNTRTPQDIPVVLYPFTLKERQVVLNSPTTLQILSYNNLSPLKQLRSVNEILQPFNIVLFTAKEIEDKLKSIQ